MTQVQDKAGGVQEHSVSEWLTESRLLSRHGRVLLYISRHPGQTGTGIAAGLRLRIGSVWTVIGDLRTAGMITVRNQGRRHIYYANMDAPLGDLPAPSLTVGIILDGLTEQEPTLSYR